MTSIHVRSISVAGLMLAIAVVFAPSSFAQGTASSPTTSHTIDNTLFLGIGPQPIDLDPNGGPWTKDVFGIPGLTLVPGDIVPIRELVTNVGTEPWTDWHEHILPDASGAFPGFWSNFIAVSIDGNPAAAVAAGVGGPNLWLDPIVPAVLPGQTLEISKELTITTTLNSSPNFPLFTLQQYPTPEPASLALLGTGGILALARRRRID